MDPARGAALWRNGVRAIAAACAISAAAILVAKFALASRINVNWDEFYFLTHVHSLLRGELTLLLQGAYSHAFRWIGAVGGDEMQQIVVLRLVMCALLVASACLLYGTARLWASPAGALIAVLCFLASWPVMSHGASFRADSMLLPLTLGAIYFAMRRGPNRLGDELLAGACLGLALVVTIKATLALPAICLMLILPDALRPADARATRAGSAARILLTAGALATVLIAMHGAQIAAPGGPAGGLAVGIPDASLINVPFAPRRDYFLRLVTTDYIYWAAVAAGLIVAIRLKAYAAAAAALTLLPILFYRNAFPYYYPPMMAPASILIGLAADRLMHESPVSRRLRLGVPAVAAACLVLMLGAWDDAMRLRFDDQAKQRAVVAAVHRVFPKPVPYIDHSGMIATFPKANFLMSTWGVEAYRRGGQSFMARAATRSCPPLLLVNHVVLVRGSLLYRQLGETDRRLLETGYVGYWGPIRVAGSEVNLVPDGSTSIEILCGGRYRVESPSPVVLNGAVLRDGDVVDLPAGNSSLAPAQAQTAAMHVRLLWADAHTPPVNEPPSLPLYAPL